MATFTLFFADTEVYNNVKIDRLKSLLALLKENGEDLTDFSFMNNQNLKQYTGDFFNLNRIALPEEGCNLLAKINQIANS